MYMKKHATIKRLLTLVLALTMVLVTGLSLAVPAMAADNDPPFEITINSSKNVSTPDDVEADSPDKTKLETRFWAYQIFKGEISSSYVDSEGAKTPKANQLADVKWGDSIDNSKIEALLTALNGAVNTAASVGVTFDLMLAAGDTYLDAAAFDTGETGYKEVYNNKENWVDKKIGGTLTPEGEAALKDAFNAALNAESDYLTLGQLFTAALTSAVQDKQAALVAKVLSDFTPATGNTALAQAFTAIVAEKDGDNYKYLKNTGGKAGSSYGGAYAASSWNGDGNDGNGCWTIGDKDGEDNSNLSGGYYLIRDTYSEKGNKDKANSEYIVAVFGNSTISPKSDIPTADKTIVGAENPDNAGSFEIGKEITFRVKGTLPENYDTAYDKYFYSFTDTMDAGLTYLGGGKTVEKTIKTDENAGASKKLKDVLRMYVMVPNADGGMFGEDDSKYDYYLIELDSISTYDYYTDEGYDGYTGNGYWLNITENTGNGNQTKIELTIPDLKKLKGKKVIPTESDPWSTAGSESTALKDYITSSAEIYVEYIAALNENAVVNQKDGNMNSVGLEFSNNPNWQGTGKPDTGTTETESKTYVYDFGAAINKYDGSKGDYKASDPDKNVMEGVGFALTKSGKWYPYFTSNSGTAAEGWVSETDILAYLAHFGIEKAEDYQPYLDGTKALPNTDDGSSITFPAAGKFLASSGENPPTVNNNMTAYALLKKVSASSPNKDHYAIAGWLPETELETVLENATGDTTDDKWVAAIAGTNVAKYLGVGFVADDSYFLAIETDSEGYLRIEGMGSGIVYSLVEIVTPDGYDTIDPISIEFTAEYKEDGTLKKATVKVNADTDTEGDPLFNETDWVDPYTELAITYAVPNYPAGYLPGTGGMGTTLFYIAGVVLLASAALLLLFSNMKKKGQRVQ